MGTSVFNELMKKEFDICGISKRLTKKGIDGLFTIEVKDLIRQNPDMVLVDATIRPVKDQYLFTYKLARGKNGMCHKTMTYISRYQISGYFKDVEHS